MIIYLRYCRSDRRPGSTIAQQNKEYYSKISVFSFVGFCLTAILVLLTLVLCKESVFNIIQNELGKKTFFKIGILHKQGRLEGMK